MTALSPDSLALAWTAEPFVVLPVVVTAAIYLRGFVHARRAVPEQLPAWRAVAFCAGLAAILLATCSPIDALGHRWLAAHMAQHLLLMVVAPPLIWLGAPLAPMLAGLPHRARRAIAVALATRPLAAIVAVIADPRAAWIAFSLAFWAWHLPALYDLALASDAWHHVEHACFFLTSLAFWRSVIAPWPTRRLWPRGAMIVYLLLAEAQATLLSAILTFADRVIYTPYASASAAGSLSPLDDQALAGVVMWVPGSIAFSIALLALVFEALSPQARSQVRTPPATTTPATASTGSTATSAGHRS